MADFNIMTAPVSDEIDRGHVFGEVDNELVRFPATGLGGGSGEGGSSEVPPGVVFVETDETADPLPEEGEAEEGGLDADRLGGLTPPYFVKKSDLSDAFDAEKAYAVGDYCIYENALYRFTTAKEADAAWDSSYVTPVKIADEIGRVAYEYETDLTELEARASIIKAGRIVVMVLGGMTTIPTIPEGYQPISSFIYFPVINSRDKTSSWMIRVKSNGTLSFEKNGDTIDVPTNFAFYGSGLWYTLQ